MTADLDPELDRRVDQGFAEATDAAPIVVGRIRLLVAGPERPAALAELIARYSFTRRALVYARVRAALIELEGQA